MGQRKAPEMAVYMLVSRSLEASTAFIKNLCLIEFLTKSADKFIKKGVFCKNFLDEKSKILHHQDRIPRGGGGGGGTLIFSHIRRLGPFFGVQNSEFQYFWGFSEK